MHFEWTSTKIEQILELSPGSSHQRLTGITTDSRAVRPGHCFVAIRGDTHDGHDFIGKALDAGASLVLSETPSPTGDPRVRLVPSTLGAIRTLAQAWRKGFDLPVIAVVGAVGKTTTKELLASLLEGRFQRVLKTEGSQNGFLGVALTLLRLDPRDRAAVIEIGIDDLGAMEQHLAIVDPTHVILTRTGPEHLHQLKTVEIAAAEELKAFDHALLRGLPLAINLSDPFVLAWLSLHAPRLRPGQGRTYSLTGALKNREVVQLSGSVDSGVLTLREGSWSATLNCPLPGEHHAHNLLAAVAMTRFFDMTEAELLRGLTGFKTALGRTEIHRIRGPIEIIGDHYNSNPTSLAAALSLLASDSAATGFHAVLGDMLELGTHEERYHREIADDLIRNGIGHIWLYGPRMQWLQDELLKRGNPHSTHFKTHEGLLKALSVALKPGDRVLIKGSRGMKMETILKGLLAGNPPA